MNVYAWRTALTALVGMPNQSVVVPRSRSKSSADMGPWVRMASSTRSATSAFSVIVRAGLSLLTIARNHGNSPAGTKERPLL